MRTVVMGEAKRQPRLGRLAESGCEKVVAQERGVAESVGRVVRRFLTGKMSSALRQAILLPADIEILRKHLAISTLSEGGIGCLAKSQDNRRLLRPEMQ